MAIIKPASLHNLFLRYNFELLGFKIPVGDLLELAVDQVLQKVEETYLVALRAWDKAVEVGEKATTAEQILMGELLRQGDQIAGLLAKVWPGISVVWEALRPQVADMAAAFSQEALSLVREVDSREDGLEYLINRIQNDYALRSWVLEALKTEEQKREEHIAEVQARLGLIEEKTEHWWDTLARFFNDPWLFLVEEFLKWLAGNLDTVFDAAESALWGGAQ